MATEYNSTATPTQVETMVEKHPSLNDIRQKIKNNITQSQFRIFILYPDETIKTEIPQEDIQTGGDYSEHYQDGQRRSLSFTLYNEDGKYTPNINVFWANARLRLDVGIKISESTTYWFQKGIFIVSSAVPSISPTGKTVQISASDKFSLFEGATGTLQGSYEVPINMDIENLIRDILHTNSGDGYLLDSRDFIYHSSFKGKKTQVAISKSTGDNLGSILLEIATQLSAEVYYNEYGNLVFEPTSETTLDQNKPVLYYYYTNLGEIENLSFSLDYTSIVNRVVVIGTTSTGGTFTAEAVNNDPSSPLCYQRIGYRTGDTINDSNIYSYYLAEERAEYELRKQLILESSTSSEVVFNPILKVNGVIAIFDEFTQLNNERFLIQSLSFSLDYSNKMNITFSNLNNLPFVVK